MLRPLLVQDKLELQPEQRRHMVNLRQHFLQSLAECHDSREAICSGLQQVILLPVWHATPHTCKGHASVTSLYSEDTVVLHTIFNFWGK